MLEKPLISVVMSVYNDEQFLRQAIESILNQTFKNFEFIIIDDGSTDNSGKIIDQYANLDKRITVVHQKNHGLVYSLNRGISIAKGKYIARQDGDDYSESNRFEVQLSVLRQHPEYVVVFGFHNVVDFEGKILCEIEYSCNPIIIRGNLLRRRPIYAHGSAIIKKNILEKHNCYNINETLYEDYDLWIRLLKSGERIGAVCDQIYNLRLHMNSKSINDRINHLGNSQPMYHLLQNIYFRSQNRRSILLNTFALLKTRDIKFIDIVKCLVAIQPLNYNRIFKYL